MAIRIAYLDCPSGISGDMLLGALLGAGVPEDSLRAELATIPLGDYEFKTSHVLRAGITGNRVEIAIPEKQPHRHLSHIEKLLGESGLSAVVREKALAVFRRLGEAEARLHAQPIEKVHFHEVGAVDAILDIAGTCAGLELLGISEMWCSPLNVGGGSVKAAHGTLPVPAPATAELLRGIPVYSSGIEAELVTPTGAALVSTLAAHFGPLPPMKIESIGYGAGAQDFPGHPNLARLMVGEKAEQSTPSATTDETIAVIQANVDDMSPQLFAYFMEQALAAGALDASCSPAQMKKNRPGLELTVLCAPENVERLAQVVFEQTTTLGLRIQEARRMVLERETISVETLYGTVRMKVARRNGRVMNVAPEYEDCQRLADEKSVPLKEVMIAAQTAFRTHRKLDD
ncbi:MAG TPA: nickel pincer cofactor biosynthesis protein LarC [Terriglobia bacterium]|nr:nickel pincer cofactor biosynthesis protein LarC [Terriglobia bacterium]